MFQVKIVCELKLAADDDNLNLILVDLVSSSFSTKREGVVLPKILITPKRYQDFRVDPKTILIRYLYIYPYFNLLILHNFI